jgi:hypothetical protein
MTASTSPSYSTYSANGINSNTGIAFDFSPFFDRMATALETIATKSTNIDNTLSTISTTLTNIKTDLDTLATNSTTIKNLAVGTGIHMVGPYDWLGYASLYHLYVEQGKFNSDTATNLSTADQAIALANLEAYLAKIKNLPTMF